MAVGQGQDIGSVGQAGPEGGAGQTMEQFVIERNGAERPAAGNAAAARREAEAAAGEDAARAVPAKPEDQGDPAYMKRLEARLSQLERFVLIRGGGGAPAATRQNDAEQDNAPSGQARQADESLAAPRPRRIEADLDGAHQARMLDAAKTDPTILEAARDETLPVSPPMAFIIKDSEAGPAMVRYLADHRDEAERIACMHPIAAAREMGRIEARLMGAGSSAAREQNGRGTPLSPTASGGVSPQSLSRAPEPVKTVGGTKGAVETDDEKLPIEEFVRRRNERQYGKR